MNKILTNSIVDPTIGQPFTGPSLEFLQQATSESIFGLAFSIVNSNSYSPFQAYSLIGAEGPSGTGDTFTSGFIFYSGELFYSTGWSSGPFADVPVATLDITNSPLADPIEFTDGISRNVCNIRRLKIVDAAGGSGLFDMSAVTNVRVYHHSDASILYSLILSTFALKSQEIPTIVGSGSTLYATDFQQVTSGKPLRFWKDTLGYVHIQGMCKGAVTNASLYREVFTLPAGYIPTADDNLGFTIFDNTNATPEYLQIEKSSGQVQILTSTLNEIYNIGHIMFRVD